jgi:hypothetical protein
MKNPNDCEDCGYHDRMYQERHCELFKKKPKTTCVQNTKLSIKFQLNKLFEGLINVNNKDQDK